MMSGADGETKSGAGRTSPSGRKGSGGGGEWGCAGGVVARETCRDKGGLLFALNEEALLANAKKRE